MGRGLIGTCFFWVKTSFKMDLTYRLTFMFQFSLVAVAQHLRNFSSIVLLDVHLLHLIKLLHGLGLPIIHKNFERTKMFLKIHGNCIISFAD